MIKKKLMIKKQQASNKEANERDFALTPFKKTKAPRTMKKRAMILSEVALEAPICQGEIVNITAPTRASFSLSKSSLIRKKMAITVREPKIAAGKRVANSERPRMATGRVAK